MQDGHAIYDIAVIGGGPAGMMAAGRAAELGRSVVLLEKNRQLGAKLLITARRCNLTGTSLTSAIGGRLQEEGDFARRRGLRYRRFLSF